MAKYKAKAGYDKADKNLDYYGDYQKHLALLRGEEIELDSLPEEYKELVQSASSSSSKKTDKKEDE
jgi:hypothetical protein